MYHIFSLIPLHKLNVRNVCMSDLYQQGCVFLFILPTAEKHGSCFQQVPHQGSFVSAVDGSVNISRQTLCNHWAYYLYHLCIYPSHPQHRHLPTIPRWIGWEVCCSPCPWSCPPNIQSHHVYDLSFSPALPTNTQAENKCQVKAE